MILNIERITYQFPRYQGLLSTYYGQASDQELYSEWIFTTVWLRLFGWRLKALRQYCFKPRWEWVFDPLPITSTRADIMEKELRHQSCVRRWKFIQIL